MDRGYAPQQWNYSPVTSNQATGYDMPGSRVSRPTRSIQRSERELLWQGIDSASEVLGVH